MKNQLVKFDTPELQVIEKSKAEQIKATFEPMAEMLAEFEERYNKLMAIPLEEITVDLTKEYKRLRLDVGRVRIDTGKAKDKAKEYLKLEDKAIMGIHNILVWAVKEKEDNLKERENYFEIQEQKRLEALQKERAEKLSKYVEDAHERNLYGMDEDVWEPYFAAKKKECEDRIAAEKKAEADRIAREQAESAERERIRKENERLKAEAEAREKQAEKERKAREAAEKQREILDKAASARQEMLAEIGVTLDFETCRGMDSAAWTEFYEAKNKEHQSEQQRIWVEKQKAEKLEREERERREKLEAELKAKKEAEAEAERIAEEQRQNELNKGDADKVKDLIADLQSLKTKYTFRSAKNKKMYSQVSELIDKVVNHINQ